MTEQSRLLRYGDAAHGQLLWALKASTHRISALGMVVTSPAHSIGEDLSAPNRQAQLLKRLSAFKDAIAASGPSGAAGFVGLLHKLQDGLASTESFPVVGSQLQAPMQTTSRFSSVFLGLCSSV